MVSAQLERFKDLEPGKRFIVVDIASAEKLLGGLPIMGEQDLLHRVSQLASIHFGPVKLELSIAQMRELEHRASRQGKKVEALVAEVAAHIQRDLFWVGAGGPAKSPEASVPKAEPSVSASTVGGR